MHVRNREGVDGWRALRVPGTELRFEAKFPAATGLQFSRRRNAQPQMGLKFGGLGFWSFGVSEFRISSFEDDDDDDDDNEGEGEDGGEMEIRGHLLSKFDGPLI